ncbi:homeobox protein ESX1-like [Lagenorhynchus albirostris]|uniref:homeobox protein ESX1-like n=1 Tax=Lagenorhynchus albirostris TaxID=27610 RepID=UPI0028EE1717|nr:homeobox protein ESX1-like [Lagenorhynchus albirostris]
MERQPQSSHDAYDVTFAAIARFFKLGVEEEREEAKEVKAAEMSPPGEGGEEQKAQSEPEQGAAAEGKEAGDEGEGKEGCEVSVGAAGPADGGEGEEQGGEEQPPRAAVEGPEAADGQRRGPCARFTHVQVQDLERVFQHTQYPSARMRQELTRCMGVTEDKVKVWFRSRRAKCRRHQRAVMLRNVPHVPPVLPAVVSVCRPCSAILLQELGWVHVFLEQVPLEQPLLPVPPMPPNLPVPPMPPMPPVPPMPPMPPNLPVPPEPPVPPMPPVPPNLPVPPVPPEPPVPPLPPFPPMLLPPPPCHLPHVLHCRCPHVAWRRSFPLEILQLPRLSIELCL